MLIVKEQMQKNKFLISVQTHSDFRTLPLQLSHKITNLLLVIIIYRNKYTASQHRLNFLS